MSYIYIYAYNDSKAFLIYEIDDQYSVSLQYVLYFIMCVEYNNSIS